MNKIIIIAFLLISSHSLGMAQEIPKIFKIEKDEFKGAEFITHKKSHKIYPYIVKEEGKIFLRLVAKYSGNDWIFFNKIVFLIDDEKFEVSTGKTITNVLSGGVYENADILIEDDLLLRKIADATNGVRYRLEGNEYYNDYSLTKNQLIVFKETIQLFDKISKN